MEEKIAALVNDYEVSRDQGAYEFVFDGDPRHLSLRTFDERTKKTAYKQQKGICPICKQHFEYGEMQGDHWKPWSKGGTTTPENCKMLCVACNIQKSNKQAQEIRLKAYIDAMANA